MDIKGFRDLIVWQKAMNFVVQVYQVSSAFPSDERFGLTAQLRRCAVSIPSNIAEGHGREGTREFLNFLAIAYGSLNEAQTQIMLGERLNYIPADSAANLLEMAGEVARLLNGPKNSLRSKLVDKPLTPNP